MMGIPDQQGVFHVGGRLGAAKGPESFRRVFRKLRGINPVVEAVEDLGNLSEISADIEMNHRLAIEMIRKGHSSTGFSVVIGGGHDHGFTHIKGVSEALRLQLPSLRLGCINIDAHLDVRKPSPEITSGSPFYLALEAGVLSPERFIEFGIQSHCNGPDLWKYVEAKSIEVVPFSVLRHGQAVEAFKKTLKNLASKSDAVLISLDLDAASAAFAPGVSAPQSEGFTSSEIIEMMEVSGKENKVVSLGIFELNPEHDLDLRTARLGATSVYHFIESALF
jgi:formiminoglutamase